MSERWLSPALVAIAVSIAAGCANPGIPRPAQGAKVELFANAIAAVDAAKVALAEARLGSPRVETIEFGSVVHGELSGLAGAVYNSHGGRGAVTIRQAFPGGTRLTISVTTQSRLAHEPVGAMDALKGYNYNDPQVAASILQRMRALLPQDNIDSLRAEDERARVAYEAQQRLIAAQLEKERAALAKLIAEAAAGARFVCAGAAECRKAFALAQIYVNTRSDMKIQLATDTIVETFNPTDPGKLGARVIKTPGRGDTEEIVLTVTCRECEPPQRRESYEIMKAFRPFIEGRLR